MTNEHPTASFEAAYAALNPRQKEAVDAIDGPVMVIAGPGTGKTQILTLRIANIIRKTDTAPEDILALTFTESAAANMRKRLTGLIGTPGYYVEIATFHGFANRIIQEYPEYFPAIIGGKNATDIDQIAILRAIVDEGDFRHLKPFGDPFFYVNDILAAIRDIKHEGYSPEDLSALVAKKHGAFEGAADKFHEKGAHAGKMKLEYQKALHGIEKNTELALIYAAYELRLREAKLYDFADMILETVRALEANKDFLLEVQESIHYILVDEHQDTNGAQNRLLELLASFEENPNLFVVGDEKQAIFRFQGASLENFLYFKNKYAAAKLISLEENYRSTQIILDSAEDVIQNNASTLKSPLRAVRKEDSGGKAHPIQVVRAESTEIEELFIVKRLEELLAADVLPEEIALLYRENREAEHLAEALERHGLPFTIESDRNILADPDIRKLLKLLEAVNDLGNEEKLGEAMHIDFLDIPPLDVWRLLRERAKENYISLYAFVGNSNRLGTLGLEAPDRIHEFFKKLETWKRQSLNAPFLEFFEAIVRESGFLKHILGTPGYIEKVGKLNTLFDEVKKAVGSRGDYDLRDFMQYLAILREHRVSIRAKAEHVPHAIRLMTAHRAKGLEFDYVFITGACDGRWGNKRRMNRFELPFPTSVDASELERNEDERRLFYMALTRARKRVWITHAEHASDGKAQVPSQFLAEIRGELKEEISAAVEGDELRMNRDIRFRERHPSEPRIDDKEFLRELFRERGFSVTALNNYLECPWRYFYVNLLRLPQAQTAHQMYGIAAHAALERFFSARREREDVGKDFLLERFEESLRQHPLREKDRDIVLQKGKKTLGEYYDQYAPIWSYRVLTEYAIRGVKLSDDVILTGKLDKVELLDAPQEVAVVDYKLKQPESRNWIEGNTAASNGAYKRQLVFYKLLLDMEGKFRMRSAAIDFVEPNDRGKFKREEFVITDGEVVELKARILSAAEEILGLSFWNKGCGEKDCQYCSLREMMATSQKLDIQGMP